MHKRLKIFSLLLLVSCSLSAQETKENTYGAYGSVGVSIGNSNEDTFQNTSYPSVEVGVTKENLSLGLAFGKSSFDFKNKSLNSYWYEIKFVPSTPMGSVDIYGIFGVGNYLDTNRYFIEYGGGVTGKLTNHLNYFVQASSWDGFWYVTPGVTFSL